MDAKHVLLQLFVLSVTLASLWLQETVSIVPNHRTVKVVQLPMCVVNVTQGSLWLQEPVSIVPNNKTVKAVQPLTYAEHVTLDMS